MSNKILFIFEGEIAENQIIASLHRFFLNENTTVTCVFGAEIYQIYKEINADNDLDTFNLIKERNPKNRETLNGFSRSDFAEIYLFFDYDGHSSLADDDKLLTLLEFFQEETDKGKLYVSYPMVESLKHICDFQNFDTLTVDCKQNIRYKNIVDKTCIKKLINFNKYDLDTWKVLIKTHLMKMSFVVWGTYTMPEKIVLPLIVFCNQLEKYISPSSKVAVLSAFPIFLHDYYGNQGIKERLE